MREELSSSLRLPAHLLWMERHYCPFVLSKLKSLIRSDYLHRIYGNTYMASGQHIDLMYVDSNCSISSAISLDVERRILSPKEIYIYINVSDHLGISHEFIFHNRHAFLLPFFIKKRSTKDFFLGHEPYELNQKAITKLKNINMIDIAPLNHKRSSRRAI
jgi:hypothetical protein